MSFCAMVFLIIVLAVVVPTDYMSFVVAAVCVFAILYNFLTGGKK